MHFFFSREKTLSFEFLSNGFGWRWYKRLRNTSPVRLTSSQSRNSTDIYLYIRTMELLEHRAEHSILSPIAAFLRLFSTGWIISVSIGFFSSSSFFLSCYALVSFAIALSCFCGDTAQVSNNRCRLGDSIFVVGCGGQFSFLLETVAILAGICGLWHWEKLAKVDGF